MNSIHSTATKFFSELFSLNSSKGIKRHASERPYETKTEAKSRGPTVSPSGALRRRAWRVCWTWRVARVSATAAAGRRSRRWADRRPTPRHLVTKDTKSGPSVGVASERERRTQEQPIRMPARPRGRL